MGGVSETSKKIKTKKEEKTSASCTGHLFCIADIYFFLFLKTWIKNTWKN